MYAKVFTQILDSSVAENYHVRHMFEDMLKLCDLNGVVDMTFGAIARRLKMPVKSVRLWIAELEKPDPESRTTDHEGRRLVLLDDHRDWGWLIVNHAYYRQLASEEQRREKTRIRTEKWRKKKSCDAPVTHGDASDAMQKQKQKQSTEAELAPAPASVRPKTSRTRPGHEHPSLEEVLGKAQFVGLAEWKARDWFDEMQGCGWLDFQHRPIVDWAAILTRVCRKWESDGRPMSPPKPRAQNGQELTRPMDLKTVIQAKESKAAEIRAKHCSDTAIDQIWSSPEKRSEYFAIKREVKELNNKLSNLA